MMYYTCGMHDTHAHTLECSMITSSLDCFKICKIFNGCINEVGGAVGTTLGMV